MPETFNVDICYNPPCHWTSPEIIIPHDNRNLPYPPQPPQDLPKLDVSQIPETQDRNRQVPGRYGDHVDSTEYRRIQKRAPAPEPEPEPQVANPALVARQESSRQGPPLPERPPAGGGHESEGVRHTSESSIDPDVQKLALDRQHATQTEMKISRPPSFQGSMDTRYILRPEAIESVFYMWRITGDPEWQEKGWKMWESIEKVTWTELAYSAITDVNDPESPQADSMERYYAASDAVELISSFWLAETLKYFYLLYSEPDLISLDEWVLNTEAHPFRRPQVPIR
jgi:Glycosyl hydrolase family 47